MQIHQFSKIGEYHLSHHQNNQDFVYRRENTAAAAIVLADETGTTHLARPHTRTDPLNTPAVVP